MHEPGCLLGPLRRRAQRLGPRRDAAGNTDPSPAAGSFTVDTSDPVVTPPAAGADDGAIPGTGAVLRQDLGTSADPIPLWRKIESAYSQQSGANPQVLYRTSGGDPRPAIGQSQPSPGYRTLLTTHGMQSLYDAGVGNDSTRTQLISNSNTDTFYPFQPGERYIVYFSVRFEDPASVPGDGLSQNSQIMQIKNTGTGPQGTRRMIIGMQEAENQLHLTRALDRNSAILMRHTGFARRVAGSRSTCSSRRIQAPDGSGSRDEPNGDPAAELQPLTDRSRSRLPTTPRRSGGSGSGHTTVWRSWASPGIREHPGHRVGRSLSC